MLSITQIFDDILDEERYVILNQFIDSRKSRLDSIRYNFELFISEEILFNLGRLKYLVNKNEIRC